ncbi:hypothetical protein BPOR_0240g00010 [Botrytis porri]|uniref:Uncharacterized protein n=1 Tax=Botrytis porri TaxID=87229 RepID=A0A4Z1KTA5_9HELO|nr:hypothetical protein BPOR_0240g00010 [Botrytis porri]
MPRKNPFRMWTQAEKTRLQQLLQERYDEGRYWRDSRTSRKFLTKKMNEEFPARDQPGGRMFFERHVEEYLREWVENHRDPRLVEMPERESEEEEEEEGEDEGDDDDDDDDGSRDAMTNEVPERQGKDRQDVQDAQDTGYQAEEGEDSDADADEERGRGRERREGGKSGEAEARKANKKLPKRERAIVDDMKTVQASAIERMGD